jgi:CheY-like chemotaxis protein
MGMEISEVAVLVVEDDELVRALAVEMVAAVGFRTYEAIHADDAMKLLEKHSDIRIVFTDVEMPGTMDGVKLAHYIRHHWPPIQLIVASGHVRLVEQDLPIGTVFITKPYTFEYIADRLREVAARLISPH